MCLPNLENGRLFSMRARACGCFESQPCPAPYTIYIFMSSACSNLDFQVGSEDAAVRIYKIMKK